jgi:hypothetical protein
LTSCVPKMQASLGLAIWLYWGGQAARPRLSNSRSKNVIRHAYERIARGDPMPGVLAVHQNLSLSQIVEDLLLLAECSFDGEYEGRVWFLPLR